MLYNLTFSINSLDELFDIYQISDNCSVRDDAILSSWRCSRRHGFAFCGHKLTAFFDQNQTTFFLFYYYFNIRLYFACQRLRPRRKMALKTKNQVHFHVFRVRSCFCTYFDTSGWFINLPYYVRVIKVRLMSNFCSRMGSINNVILQGRLYVNWKCTSLLFL